MWEMVRGLISGLIGTIVGCVLTWYFMRGHVRNEARRETLLKAAEALEDFRTAYALWYVEYLSPQAQASGSWAKPPGEGGLRYLELMKGVDMGRGRLRVVSGALYAHFRQDEIRPLCKDITEVLVKSGHQQHTDCREVDAIVERACDLIPDMIRRFL